MKLRQLFFTENDCYKKGEYISPKGIMLHSTGANNPTLRRYVGPDDGLIGENQYGNHWNQPGIEKCVHAFIGKLADGSVAAYQTLPWNMRGWHCGRSGNDTHISIEMCEDGLTDSAYFVEVYETAVELCAHLCREYGLNPMEPGVLIDHEEGHDLGIASNHGDVGYWLELFGKNMDSFRADVAKKLDGTLPFSDVPEDAWYRRDVEWAWEAGIANGREPDKFDPEANVKRSEIVAMLHRFYKHIM